ncbi:MAG: penicillin-binding protein [Spirochaetales bacterium]
MQNRDSNEDTTVKRRIRVAAVLLSISVVALSGQYARIMLFEQSQAATGSTGSEMVERGAIVDRTGQMLAVQTELDTVSAWIPDVADPEDSASLLAPLLDTSEESLLQALTGPRNYVYLARRVSPRVSEEIRELKDSGDLRGISLEPDYGRTYPGSELAAHVVGHVGRDNTGLDGIEYAYDSYLSPDEGRVRGNTLYGNQLVLTIDSNIQATTDRLARETMERENAESVMILVMDANNGDMLSWSSLPTYNPNDYQRYDDGERRNRPIRMVYEPGSVFKIFSVSAMMQTGAVSDDDTFETDGTYRPDSWGDVRPITDITDYGTMDLRRVIERSSNVGVSYASEGISENELYDSLMRFGFGEPTGVGLAGEESGVLTPPEQWSYRSKPTISMGQEIGVTAIQMASAATALANDGIRLQPNLVKQVVSPSGEIIEERERTPVREAVSPSVADTMLDYMRTATYEDGTGRLARVEGLPISAKTGTAEFFDRELGRYSQDKYVGSTLAMLPSDDPEIIIYMVVENPRGQYIWGERVAAPVVRETAEFLIPYMGIERADDEVIHRTADLELDGARSIDMTDRVPDLSGLSRRSLLSLHEYEQVDLDIQGSGWVVRQDPQPGTPVEDGMRITVELE